MQINELFPALDPVVSAFNKKDIILSKLEWFKMGGEVSEHQWRDIIGVLKVQENNLDMEYLQKWIDGLHLSELWERLLEEK